MATRDMRSAPPSPEAERRLAEIRDGLERGTIGAQVRAANPQVTAFWQITTDISTVNLPKASDLLKRGGRRPADRHPLTDPDARMRKLSIETGWDARTGHFLAAPLEPWTGPPGSMREFERLMRGEIPDTIGAFPLDTALYLKDEDLAMITEDGRVIPLSDASPPPHRAYPGARVKDEQAGIGSQLREVGPALMKAAYANLSTRRTARRVKRSSRRRERITAGLEVTAIQLCEEANAIKARFPALDRFRWMSLSTARRIIRKLVRDLTFEEISAPKPVRQHRSWRMLPRILRRLPWQEADRYREELAPPPRKGEAHDESHAIGHSLLLWRGMRIHAGRVEDQFPLRARAVA